MVIAEHHDINEAAIREVYHRYGGAIHTVASSMLPSRRPVATMLRCGNDS